MRFAQLIGEPLAIVRSTEAVVALDRRTWEGLTSGQVALPRPTVHVGVWLRLLRRLLHELSQPLSRLGRAQSAGKTVWQAIDQPVRAGMGIWRPYEQLQEERQHALLEAAAVTLALIEAGKIDARGTSAPLLMPDLHNEVYAGDPPDPKSPRTDGRRRKSTH